MDYETLKLECMKLATAQGLKGQEARSEAEHMFNQITGRNQGDLVGGGKARVVGKDNDLPFKDYKPE